jgi:hypothetical protein
MELLRFDDFCLSTGLDRVTAEYLFRTVLLEHTLWTLEKPSRPASIRADKQPSRETLVSMGLSVRDDYDPSTPRHGGIECQIHGWAPTLLLTRYDAEDQREVPDRAMCWECSRIGAVPDHRNSVPLEADRVERWRRTHDRDGTWIGLEDVA